MSKRQCFLLTFFFVVSCVSKSSNSSHTKRDVYASEITQTLDKENFSKEEELVFLRNKVKEIKASKELQSVELLIELCERFRKRESYNDYINVANELMNFGKRTKDTFSLASAHHKYAIYYKSISKQIDSAYANYFKAAKYYKASDSLAMAGKTYLSMAILQKNASDYIGAEVSSIEALELLKEANEMRFVASAYNNLGLVAKALNKPKLAREYFDRVLTCRKKLNNGRFLQAGTYNNIGITYINEGSYYQAIDNYNKGLSIQDLKKERPVTFARLLDNKGYALFLSGNTKEALLDMEQSYQLRDSINDILGKSTGGLHLGDFYRSQGDEQNAQYYYTLALKDSRESNYNAGVLQALQSLSQITSSDKAIAYAQEHIRLNDSLIQAERAIQDHFARVRYETDELKVEKSKAQEQTKWMTIALLSAIVFFLTGYIIKQRAINKRKRLFLQEQQKANEEIYTLMLGQQSKIELAKQKEKDRISRELHDGVLSRLFGIRLSLDTLNIGSEEKHIASRAGYIEQLKEVGQEIRQISHDLQRNNFEKDDANPETIKSLIADYCEKMGVKYSFVNDDTITWENISYNVKVHLCRILQEGLANSVKHGKATSVDVAFKSENSTYVMRLEDNGLGLSSKRAPSGIGLKNMKYRVRQIGGKLDIRNRENTNGTQVTVYFSGG